MIDSVARKYREHDMPGGWILPNDGYGCGYKDLPKVVQGLAKYGFRTGLWTENGVDKIAWEVGKAGTRVQKLDVAWTGKGYQFAMDANKSAFDGLHDIHAMDYLPKPHPDAYAALCERHGIDPGRETRRRNLDNRRTCSAPDDPVRGLHDVIRELATVGNRHVDERLPDGRRIWRDQESRWIL